MKKKVIIGIDPSLNNIGVGVISLKGKLKQGQDFITFLISPPSKASLPEKILSNIQKMQALIDNLTSDYSIHSVIIEIPSHYYHKGFKMPARVLMPYALMTGVVIGLFFAHRGVLKAQKVLYYAPSGKSGLKTKKKADVYLSQIFPNADWSSYSSHEKDALVLALYQWEEINGRRL